MTREVRHNISMIALGAIVLTAAAFAKPDVQADGTEGATIAEQPAEGTDDTGLELAGVSAGR